MRCTFLLPAHLTGLTPENLKTQFWQLPDMSFLTSWNLLICPTLIIDTSRDGFHRNEDIRRMVNSIRGSTYVDLEKNKRTHSPEIGTVIRNYLYGLSVNQSQSD